MRNPINVAGRPGLAQVPAHIALQRTINQPIGGGRFHSKVPALMDMDIDMDGGHCRHNIASFSLSYLLIYQIE